MKSFLLDQDAWDLILDAAGNLAVGSDPYAFAQDAANAIQTFQGEIRYDTTHGVAWIQDIMDHLPPTSLIKSDLQVAALQVPRIVEAKVILTSFQKRIIQGQVLVTDTSGTTLGVSL